MISWWIGGARTIGGGGEGDGDRDGGDGRLSSRSTIRVRTRSTGGGDGLRVLSMILSRIRTGDGDRSLLISRVSTTRRASLSGGGGIEDSLSTILSLNRSSRNCGGDGDRWINLSRTTLRTGDSERSLLRISRDSTTLRIGEGDLSLRNTSRDSVTLRTGEGDLSLLTTSLVSVTLLTGDSDRGLGGLA